MKKKKIIIKPDQFISKITFFSIPLIFFHQAKKNVSRID
jgi:hypothetical protein